MIKYYKNDSKEWNYRMNKTPKILLVVSFVMDQIATTELEMVKQESIKRKVDYNL